MEVGVVTAVVVFKFVVVVVVIVVVVVMVVVEVSNGLSELVKTVVALGVAFDVVDIELGALVGGTRG